MKRYKAMANRPRAAGQTQVGSAVENRNGSVQVYLTSMPIDGELVLVPECQWCARLGVGTTTAEAAHRAGHPERSRAEGDD